MRRAQFIVEVRFEAEKSWRKHTAFTNVVVAIDKAKWLTTMGDGWVFPNVRVRYCGMTLALWKLGSFVR